MGVSKNLGYPKMDGENNGKSILKWMIGVENPLFLETSIYFRWKNHGQIMEKNERTAHLEDPAQLPRHAIVSCLMGVT